VVADPRRFKKLVDKQVITYKSAFPPYFEPFSEVGTTMITESMNAMGIFPVCNFQEGHLQGVENITAENYAKIKVKNSGCYNCIVHCGNVFKVEKGLYGGVTNEGPDYESIWAFSGTIGSSDIGSTVIADTLCDDLGMDTISCGNTIGFAYELFDKGLLTTEDTDGLELTFGNCEAMIKLIQAIGERKGLGDLLAEGCLRAAQKIGGGAQQYAMQVKGQEMPAYEPRAVKGHGLNIATSNFGANHVPGYMGQEVYSIPIPRPVETHTEEGKGDILKLNQDVTAFYELLIACAFTAGFGWMPVTDMCEMLFAATGIKEFEDHDYMLKVGERVWNLERAFNIREGFSRKDDMLPDRFLTEPLKNAGPSEGQVYKNYDLMLDEYYTERGWDKDGIPTEGKLSELDLENIIEEICKTK
jgi:aldehyde:ferredoxin oxidoreductase